MKELKAKQSEIQKLTEIIEKKENENDFGSNYGRAESGSLGFGGKIDIHFSQEIEEKNTRIINLEKEIDNFKKKNDKLFEENSTLKERMDIIQSKNDENIDNLKKEIKNKTSQIQKLIIENNSLKNNAINNNFSDREISINNNINENNSLRKIDNSTGLNDLNVIKLLKDEIKEYKIINESDNNQFKTLKGEIKIMNDKIKDLDTFGGKMKNMAEFFSLLNLVLYNYKPIKKEQKEALNKIMEVLNNNQKK